MTYMTRMMAPDDRRVAVYNGDEVVGYWKPLAPGHHGGAERYAIYDRHGRFMDWVDSRAEAYGEVLRRCVPL